VLDTMDMDDCARSRACACACHPNIKIPSYETRMLLDYGVQSDIWSARVCPTVSFATPVEHAVLVCVGVAACGCPIPIHGVQRGTPSWVVWNNAASSASVVDTMTLYNMLMMV
jgi:hypothetical protein